MIKRGAVLKTPENCGGLALVIVFYVYLYADVTEKIIGASMKIHRYLGNGFHEVIYQRCLEIELKKLGFNFEREKEQTVFYEEVLVGTKRVDFPVEEKFLVELKATTQLENVHLAQAINYLEAFELEVALLINFGATSLQYRRLQNKYRVPK
ncbi:GxxExxY protein [Chryseolinea sp. H1M3-3]|uniref:GxxExxY protein n=1 Tax=Chryseolinea sp. H1M3-3 TaxID=3034144 RepID=UPI0023EDB210|nr:GxxExxY protein [Chryseolinea sp. H1M3-3]